MLAEKEIVELYVKKKLSGREVAKRTNTGLWKVQQILRKHGVARSLSEAQKRLYETGYQHPFKTKLNTAKVIRQFLEERKSLPLLAKQYGCSVTPLKKILRENGIQIRKTINEDLVIELYVQKSLSGREISKRTGYSLGAVQTVLQKHNVARNLKEARANLFKKGYKHPFKKELGKDIIILLYTKENVSIPGIAKLFNCSLAPILRILKENNVPTKSPSESHKGKPSFWAGKKRPEISAKLKGRKVSEKTRERLRLSHLGQKSTRKGKTYNEIYGEQRAKDLKRRSKLSHLGIPSSKRGKTLEQLFGKEKAEEMREKISQKSKEQFFSEEARTAQAERILKFIREHPEWKELKRKNTKEFAEKHPEYKDAQSKRMKEYYSKPENKELMIKRMKEYYQNHPEALRRMSEVSKKIWNTNEKREFAKQRRLRQKMPYKNTLPEKLIFEEMGNRGITFEKHRTLFHKFQPDAVIKEKKIAIFVDGDYWHVKPNSKYAKKPLNKAQIDTLTRDKWQNEMLKQNGWKVLRFWESDIKRDVSACGNEIEKALNDG